MNKQLLIGGILSIAVVLILVILFGTGNNGNQTSPAKPTQDSSQNEPETVIVTVEDSGFSPDTVTIKAGTRVSWINNSGGEISINSDDHPTHQLYPDLNIGLVPDGLNANFVFENHGTYTYHDHLNPTRTGTIVVQ